MHIALPSVFGTSTVDEEVFICFEGKVRAEQQAIAEEFYGTLSDLVVTQPGFISQTPFLSIDQEGGQVLYVRFDNEEHLHAWKNLDIHLKIQHEGRSNVFSDYRLRIGKEATKPPDEPTGCFTESAGKYLLLWQYPGAWNSSSATLPEGQRPLTQVGHEVWQNLLDAATYHSGTHVLRISSWPTLQLAQAVLSSIRRIEDDDIRVIKVQRDYGKFQRGEAPKDADRCQEAAAVDDQVALADC